MDQERGREPSAASAVGSGAVHCQVRIGTHQRPLRADHDEFDRLAAATPERWTPLLWFLVASGCRWGEAAALKPGDINLDEQLRKAWNILFTDSQFVGVTWWNNKTYTPRGIRNDRNGERGQGCNEVVDGLTNRGSH